MTAISAYIPCFNDERTVVHAIQSIQAQKMAVSELFVFDDGSTDKSAAVAAKAGAQVVSNPVNEGRGTVRAKAMNHVNNELVLCCDAGFTIAPDFLERALAWLLDDQVAAVRFGRFAQLEPSTVIRRWRDRHLYKLDNRLDEHADFATGAALVRKSTVLAAGNFNPQLRYAEDHDLGKRLLASGHKIIRDPELAITDISEDSLVQLLERYWRWYSVIEDAKDWHCYLQLVRRSLKIQAKEDLKCGDILALPISLLAPHYRFARSWKQEFQRQNTISR